MRWATWGLLAACGPETSDGAAGTLPAVVEHARPKDAGSEAASESAAEARETGVGSSGPSLQPSLQPPRAQVPSPSALKTVPAAAKLAARSCVLVHEESLPRGAGRFVLGREAEGAVSALSTTDDGLKLWQITQSGIALRHTYQTKAAPKRAAFVQTEEKGWAAWIDVEGRVFLSAVEGGRIGAPRNLAEGVDRRFAPALWANKTHALLAFTRSHKDAMHVHVARIHENKSTLEDVTPEGHGAAGPAFVLGQSPVSLVFIDARAGVSPLLEVPFDAAFRPQAAGVRTPVSQPYAPPALQAVAVAKGEVQVAFTAIGQIAATAIGLVPLHRPVSPVALVPSKGYGELELAAAQNQGLSVLAVEAFRTASKGAAKTVQVFVVDSAGAGAALSVGEASISAAAPSLIASASAGRFWLTYSTEAGTQLAQLACAK